jgi:hypothetical protein
MILKSSVRASVDSWYNAVKSAVAGNKMPQAAADGAAQIRRMFFQRPKIGTSFDPNSVFYLAPPIWIQHNAKVCADGSVSPQGGPNLVDSSYMPDLYVYVNDQPVNLAGGAAQGPAQLGDFESFSHPSSDYVPWTPFTGDFKHNPWDSCTFDTSNPNYSGRRNGSPWVLLQIENAHPNDDDDDDDDDDLPSGVRMCNEAYYPPEYHTEEDDPS